MKKRILLFLLFIFKWHLRFIYFFIKLFTKQRKEVFFLSRQFDFIPLNYELLIKELESRNIKSKVICRKVSNGLNAIIRNEKKKHNLFKELVSVIGYYFN